MINFLIVDDEKRLAKSYELLIKSIYKNVHISYASNGKEALEIVHTRDYTVIISDINMPVMNGIEFHKKLKEDHPHLATRVAFISGRVHSSHSSYINEEKCLCLPKPFEPEAFYKLIDHLL